MTPSLTAARSSVVVATAVAARGVGADLAPASLDELYRLALGGPVDEFLARPGKRFRARLVELSFAAAGGRGRIGRELGAAIELIHAGSLIIDDIEDASTERRGGPALHIAQGLPLALNAGSWLYFAGLDRIAHAGLPQASAGELLARAVATLRACHEGQALDLAAHPASLPAALVPALVAEVTAKKTAALIAFGAEAGAVAAGAVPDARAALVRLGGALGTALQILDDVGGMVSRARRDKGLEDLRLGRPTWPWAFLAERDPVGFVHAAGLAAAGRHAELRLVLAAEAPAARARAAALLVDALATARATLRDNQALDELADEIQRLQVSYG